MTDAPARPDADAPRATGSCLCAGVRYSVHGPLRPVMACHCEQCRRSSGNFVAASRCDTADLVIEVGETLAWYRSSPTAERGFCRTCGGNLFWRPTGGTTTSIMAGTLDGPTGLRLREHIYVADKGDWYEISDGKPQFVADTPAGYDGSNAS
jgi:hypothetical protein